MQLDEAKKGRNCVKPGYDEVRRAETFGNNLYGGHQQYHAERKVIGPQNGCEKGALPEFLARETRDDVFLKNGGNAHPDGHSDGGEKHFEKPVARVLAIV